MAFGGFSRPGKRAIAGSVVLHLAAVAALVASALAREPELPEFQVYRVEMISPPPQVEGPPQPISTLPEPEPDLVEREREEVRPEPEPVRAEVPKPTVDRPTPQPAERRPEPEPEPEEVASSGQAPDPTSEGGEGLDVRLEGEAFPYPGYLENIIRQINRYFRWTGAPGLSAEVYFVIRRDGSVEDIRILRGSGNFQFDIQAEGAIEVAGNRRAFGALPDGFRGDMLPISFTFTPAGG